MGMLMNRHRDLYGVKASKGADASEGAPDKSWTNDQLKEFAKANDIDLAGATKKADYLAAIEDATTSRAAEEKAKAEQTEREAHWPTFHLTVPNPDNADQPLHTGDVKAEDAESAVAAFRQEHELADDTEIEVDSPTGDETNSDGKTPNE